MIEFEKEASNDIQSQLNELQTHAKLLQALANFHIDGTSLRNLEDIENQRGQLRDGVKRLNAKLDRFQKLLKPAEAVEFSHKSDAGQIELLDEFIERAISSKSRDSWNTDDFTGSLHVFMIDGNIDSCSLIPKRDLHHTPVFTEEDSGHALNNEDIKVIQGDENTFSILKKPPDQRVNIYFSLSEPAFVIIKIFDQDDRLLRHIENLYNEGGDYSVEWDGYDNEGKEASKGSYYCQLQVGEALTKMKNFSLS